MVFCVLLPINVYIYLEAYPTLVPMYVAKIPNRNSNPTWLIRESKRVNGKIVKTTLANITKLPSAVIEGLRILLAGGTAVKSIQEVFTIRSNTPHGHVAAVLGIMKQLRLPELIAPKNSRFRRLALGMIAARVIKPASKLATSSMLDVRTAASTLNEELRLKCVDEEDLYHAMDQLVKHKTSIEQRLASRHLREGGMVLYDVTSSYVEGQKNELAEFGYNRDKKRGKQQIVIGLMTDPDGCPVSVEVFPGNTADVSTLSTQVAKLQQTFGLQQVVLVGDRGILQQKQIQEELIPVGLDWITAMKKNEIRAVVEQEQVQMSLFDEQDVMELHSDLYPSDRLVLCRNPLQAEKSRRQREALLLKTENALDKIVAATKREQRRLKCKGTIGVRVGKVIGKYKVGKFFTLEIEEEHFAYERNQAGITKAERLDGLYAIRSSLKQEPEAAVLVADYKRLSAVEQAFRTLKTISLRVRPIHHRKKNRVIAHVFLCMLAYYVEYHLRRKLAPILFAEDDPAGKAAQRKNAVEPAKPSPKAKKKARTKRTNEDEKVMSFAQVMEELSGLCRLVVVPKISTDPSDEVVMMETISPTQHRVFKLLGFKP